MKLKNLMKKDAELLRIANTKPDGLAETNPILIRITTKVKVAVAVACINELFPKGYIPRIKFKKCVTNLQFKKGIAATDLSLYIILILFLHIN